MWNRSSLCRYMRDYPEEGYLVGDSGYALEGVLLVDFVDPQTEDEKKFNREFKSFRSSVERAIGLWKEKWGILHHKRFGPLLYEPGT